MYEMKGALSGHSPGSAGFPASRLRVSQSPGLTVPDRLVSQPHRPRSTGRPTSLFRFVRLPGLPGATRRPPVPGTRCKFRFPGLYIVPGETPWMVPVSCGKNISTPSGSVAQEPVPIHFRFFPVHILSTEFRRLSACRSGYPLPYAQLLHRSPGVTQRIPAMTAHRYHSVFSRRPSVNPEFPPCPSPSAPSPSAQPSPRPERHGSALSLRPDVLDPGFHRVRPPGNERSTRRPNAGVPPSPAAPRSRHHDSSHPPVSGRRRPGPGPGPGKYNCRPESVYHRHMTSRQAPKRPGCMNPAPRLSAAVPGGVVAW